MLDSTGGICPLTACSKYLLNGACGGSRDGWCEVWPERRRCLFVRVYDRLCNMGQVHKLMEGILPPRNWLLYRTSAWLNFFLGKDHHRYLHTPIDNRDY